jgi:hypothetical protein
MKPRRRLPHAQIHLPPLDAGYALTLVDIFERAIAAIWRAHGDHMVELVEMRRANANESAAETEWVLDGDPNASDDTSF